MIKSVVLGEEIDITTKNKVGLLTDVSMALANEGINIEAIMGYGVGDTAKLLLITNANIRILDDLRKKGYTSVEEKEVVLVELENKPGALKVLTTELSTNGVNIDYLYVTSSFGGGSSKVVLHTSDNEKAMALLTRYI